MQLHIGVYLFLLFVVRTINLLMTYMQVHLHIRRAVPGNPQGFLALNIYIHLFYIVFLCIFTNTFSTSYFFFTSTFCIYLFHLSFLHSLFVHLYFFYILWTNTFCISFDFNFIHKVLSEDYLLQILPVKVNTMKAVQFNLI